MKNSIRFIVSMTLVFVFFSNALLSAKACGPYTLSPLFSLTKHADFPLINYTNGKPGIVPDSFGRMSLFVFYRELSNLPLSTEEQKQVVEAMEMQIFYRSSRNEMPFIGETVLREIPNYYDQWAAARAKITSEKRDIETEKQVVSDYNYFSNCLPDAFNNATKTLEARLAKYGNNENVKEWLKGQDMVFANCQITSSKPEPLGENSPEWLRQDREYQIAAAEFYQSDFPAARETFEKIAADDKSVWKLTAKFVAARTFIRQASLIVSPEDEESKAKAHIESNDLLQKATDKLQNILGDSSANEFHKSASRLLALVKYRMIPEERQKELAEMLVQPAENQNIYNDLTDYRWLLDYAGTQAETKGATIDAQEAEKAGKTYSYSYKLKLRDLPADERKDDLTDWLFTYQAADGFQHAFDKWKETGKQQWFVAAITKTDSKSAQIAEILSEADKVQPNSAAYATVRFHQIRLLLETGKRAAAKQKLDEIINSNLKTMPLSTQNKFFAQRMSIADNLGDFLKFAQRKPVIFEWDENDREEGTEIKDDEKLAVWKTRTMFDNDAVGFLNEKVPLSVLREAALSPQLPEHLKKFLVIAIWTRAFIAGNQAVEREFTPLMARYGKEFAPLFAKYASAANPTDREAAAMLTILNYPVIEPFVETGFGRDDSNPEDIDSIRGNWWCTDLSTEQEPDYADPTPAKTYPNFLTAEQKSSAEREKKQLKTLGNSGTNLARRAVDFAVKNPNHAQTPEILHLAVRATRYGCTDDETLKFSKQAFDILHKRFPNNPWTKKTPYWFGNK